MAWHLQDNFYAKGLDAEAQNTKTSSSEANNNQRGLLCFFNVGHVIRISLGSC